MHPIVEQILRRRGITDFEKFLRPSLGDLVSPSLLPGVDAAADVVLAAVRDRLPIVVFGDYDCDGICATSILVKTLSALGADVEPFLPARLSEGYGMSDLSVARMLKGHEKVGLLITVDNGINSVKQIAELKARGVKVVVTDHHLPGDELPAADAIVNPKVAAPPELSDICGAAVAFLLANRVVSEAKARGMYSGPSIGGPLLVLAGLATITDIMPLLGQNRILVAEALRRFGAWAPVGLKELLQRAARSGYDSLGSKCFGFVLGPRINAAGRLASGAEALELMMTEDREIARECARIVDGYNVERKAIEQKMTDEAMAKVVEGASAQVIDLPDGHPGVAGIVAARVLERLDVPVCVLAGGHGSARAPAGLNIRDAFIACDAVLERYGGHAAAGGFSVRSGQVDRFRELLCDYCTKIRGQAPKPADDAPDLWIEPEQATVELAAELKALEPYGEANAEPVFGFRNVYFTDVKPLGADLRHLSLSVKGGLRGVWWGRGDLVERLRSEASKPHDVTFSLVVSDYGERHAELRVVSIRNADEKQS